MKPRAIGPGPFGPAGANASTYGKNINMTTAIESNDQPRSDAGAHRDAIVLAIADPHQRLTQVTLADDTGRHNQLVRTQQWLLHHKDADGQPVHRRMPADQHRQGVRELRAVAARASVGRGLG